MKPIAKVDIFMAGTDSFGLDRGGLIAAAALLNKCGFSVAQSS